MGFQLRICKNATTDLLRQTFKATPVNPPESTIKPMLVFAMKDGKAERRGEFHYLLESGQKVRPEVRQNRVSDAALERTQSVEIDAGLKIMEALLRGFHIDSAPVTSALSGAREISFSFTNVRRLSIDMNQLGKQLTGKKLDLQNAAAGIFLRDKDPYDMLLVTDVLVSNSLGINVESTQNAQFKVNLEAVQEFIAGAHLKVKASKHSEQSIQFEGDEALTFAFSCVRLLVDRQTGLISIGEGISPRGGKKDDPESAAAHANLDDDPRRPGFLSWD